MSANETIRGELCWGGVPLVQLAERVGQTPFYAYDRSRLAARVAAVRVALPGGIGLHYAVKANPMPALVGFMRGLVDGLDVASAGEMAVALDAGGDPLHVSFAGPGKRELELVQAVASGVLVNIESMREVDLLARASGRLGLPARVAVRINPDFEIRGAGMRMGGGAKPFGVDTEQVPSVLRAIGQAGLQFEGFHLYPGSQNLKGALIAQGLVQSHELVLRLAGDAPSPVKHVNLGGGWGIPYFPGEQALDLAPVSDALAVIQQRMARELPGAQAVLELGRYLVGEAGIYVARVLDRKLSRGQVFLVTDGGMHHHLAASGNFGQVIRRNYPVVIGNRMESEAREVASVVGPLCTPLDVLAERTELAVSEPGDLVVVFQSGAYGPSASPQAFLGHPRCAEVLV
ncbi:pyridoxal-dependent decarboxylase, exosortase A system-associated [Hydrogenophaga sp.]|uniref:pyridoxal-dependent decarboxylase, exosortase A system-associated n=1 Tax=Hydrogenophaga sp. TaxID=1904254 RepID=UPI002730D002|nr:pyridoxal-dependent decarboxylase, exosortase A system-associated [Hydrogenophaga sp.]MDP1684489.1 pyridoxal-dependent decarboxylase, exosortase A system-associated [Hydrogenophaga sp.]